MIKIIEKIYFLNFSNMYTNWVTTRYVYYQARPYIYTFSVLFILTLGFRVMKSCLKNNYSNKTNVAKKGLH
jgi:hypothetical protein